MSYPRNVLVFDDFKDILVKTMDYIYRSNNWVPLDSSEEQRDMDMEQISLAATVLKDKDILE